MPHAPRGGLLLLLVLLLLLLCQATVPAAAQPPPPQQPPPAAPAPAGGSNLFLVDQFLKRSRPRQQQAQATGPTLCSGKRPGDPIDGRYVVFFNQRQVTSASQGIATVKRGLQRRALARAASTAATTPAAAPLVPASLQQQQQQQQVTPALSFQLNAVLTTNPVATSSLLSSGSASSAAAAPSASAAAARSRLAAAQAAGQVRARRRGRPITPPVLGAVVTVAPGAAGQDVAAAIKTLDAVQDVAQSFCMAAADSDAFTCLPATMLASSIQAPIASAAWQGCLTANTWLAWWGQRCGPTLSQVQWMGVYAFDRSTGLRLPGCVKQRPAGGGALNSDQAFWLGAACGVSPDAVPTLPVMVCTDPYVASTVVDAAEQNCLASNFTEAAQTLQLFHPTPGCGGSQPVAMVYRGVRCTANDGSSGASNPSTAGVLWQTAAPAPGSGLDTALCSLARKPGATADEALFNVDWFGSCGVPPARVQYAPRSECPAPPPPPPPSPSPRPEDQPALDREPLLPGEAVTPNMRRVLALEANSSSPSGWSTVKLMAPTTVAVIDSGVDCNHRDLNVVFNISFNEPLLQNDPLRDRNACWDMYDHGTNVAGIIGAKNNGFGTVGVLPNTAIASLKALDSNGEGPADNLLQAAMWLLSDSLDGVTPNEGNATNAEVLGVDAVNLSLGAPGSPYEVFGSRLCAAFTALAEAGIVSVAAAGNEGSPANNALPAACPGIISVTALNQSDGSIDATQTPPYWSNYLMLQGASAPPTENKANFTVGAPGYEIYNSCWQLANPQGYCAISGTSQATPHVTGMLARCFSGGRCKKGGSGGQSAVYALDKWAGYNLANPEYGDAADPIRSPKSNRYYGYLTCAGVW